MKKKPRVDGLSPTITITRQQHQEFLGLEEALVAKQKSIEHLSKEYTKVVYENCLLVDENQKLVKENHSRLSAGGLLASSVQKAMDSIFILTRQLEETSAYAGDLEVQVKELKENE